MNLSNSSTFWVAGHITTFFYIDDKASDLLHRGSGGFGLNLNRGVKTSVTLSSKILKPVIYFDEIKQDPGQAKVSETVIELFKEIYPNLNTNLVIKHTFEVPIGSGFGSSASGAVGLTFALAKLFKLRLHVIELWQIAHKAEIRNTTGLGDVIGLFSTSKFEIRVRPGAPGIGVVESVYFNLSNYDIYSVTHGSLSTHEVLTDPTSREKITRIGKECVNDFKKSPDFENFIILSNKFSKNVNLLSKELKKLAEELKDNYCAQIMLGDGLLIFIPKSNSDVIRNFKSFTFTKEELTNETLREIIS